MNKHGRTWLSALGEVLRAIRADPGLLFPALVVVVLAAMAGYLAWRFI